MFFFFNDTATTEIYTLSLHDALPICWYLLVLIGIPLLMLLGAFVVLGTVPLDALAHNWPVIFTGYPIYVVYIAIFTGLGEEPGWRGFALPRLQERHGPLLGTAVLAALWAAWHLPNVLFEIGRSVV